MSSSGAMLLSIYVSKFESLFKAVRKTAEMRGGGFGKGRTSKRYAEIS